MIRKKMKIRSAAAKKNIKRRQNPTKVAIGASKRKGRVLKVSVGTKKRTREGG